MNSFIPGSDDHRGSSSFHHRVEELFFFVQFYWVHCDRSSISIYFLIKRVIPLALALVWVAEEEETESAGAKFMAFEIPFPVYFVEILRWNLIYLLADSKPFTYKNKFVPNHVDILGLWSFLVATSNIHEQNWQVAVTYWMWRNRKWKAEMKCE